MSHYKGRDIEAEDVLGGFRKDKSIAKLLFDGLERNGDAIALLEVKTGKTASFRQLLQESSAVGAGLRMLGLSVGDYVVFCCEKSVNAYSLLLGVIYSGATAVLPPVPSLDILHKLVCGHHIKAVICDPVYLDTLKKSIDQMPTKPSILITTDPADKSLTSLLQQSQVGFQVYEPEDIKKHVTLILFSSGTTGEPKGIQMTDVSIQLTGRYFYHKLRLFMNPSPLYWFSSVFSLTGSVFNCYTQVLNQSREVVDNLAAIDKYKIDAWFVGVGAMGRYAREPSLKNYDISSIQRVFVSGENVLSSVGDHFVKNLFGDRVKLEVIYGSTEAGIMSFFNEDHSRDHVRTGECGRIRDGVEIKITDDAGNVVPLGTPGKVLTKSVSMTLGYWGRPEVNRQTWDQDGVFDSGDAGFFDQQFNLFCAGRLSDLIDYKGTKIAPGETESVLMSHEEVVDVAVVGTPHPVDTQHVTAFVELRQGATVTSNQLLELVNGKVDELYKVRGGLFILDKLPRTITGKLLRNQLRNHKATL